MSLPVKCFYFIHSWSLCADPPSSAAGRTLTLVAKSVQNLANLVEFGAKVRFLKKNCFHWDILQRERTIFNLGIVFPDFSL